MCIGNHPYDIIAAVTPADYGVDELCPGWGLAWCPARACGLRNRGPGSACPARRSSWKERCCAACGRMRGPFGDFMQFYVPVMPNNVLMVKAITYRKDAIYQTIQAGSIEDTLYLGISREAKIQQAVSQVADVAAVALNPTILGGAVAIHKKSDHEPSRVLQEVFTRSIPGSNTASWWITTSTYSIPVTFGGLLPPAAGRPTAVMKIDHLLGFPRDPHSRHDSKIGLDATVPIGRWERVRTDLHSQGLPVPFPGGLPLAGISHGVWPPGFTKLPWSASRAALAPRCRYCRNGLANSTV